MSGRLSLADLRRRRLQAGLDEDGTPLVPAPSAASATSTAAPPSPTTKAPKEASSNKAGSSHKDGSDSKKSKLMSDHLDSYLDGSCQPKFEGEPNRRAVQGRAVPSRWFEQMNAQEKEDLHDDAIVRMHHLMNPNRRASRYYETADGKRKKRLEVDYLYEESGILQAIRRSGEARVYLWYAIYFLFARLFMSAFLLIADLVVDPTDALIECAWGEKANLCGPQREGATYALWVYIANNAIAWLVCLICAYILPQYDERFNVFHIRITQFCMCFLFFLGVLTLSFEYYTYNGSYLRRVYEYINLVLTVIIFVLCRVSTWITDHETNALGAAIKQQSSNVRRWQDMSGELPKQLEAMKEIRRQKEEEQKLWDKPPPVIKQ